MVAYRQPQDRGQHAIAADADTPDRLGTCAFHEHEERLPDEQRGDCKGAGLCGGRPLSQPRQVEADDRGREREPSCERQHEVTTTEQRGVGRTRWSPHGGGIAGIGFEHERDRRVHDDLQQDQHRGQEQQRLPGEWDQQRGENEWDVERHEIREGALEIPEDPSPFAYSGDDRREVVVEEHEQSGLPRDLRPALPHGDPDVGLAQRGSVVDAVAGHGHDLPVRLQGPDEAVLLLGPDPGEDVVLPREAPKSGVIRRVEVLPDCDAGVLVREAEALGDGVRGHGMVTGDHDDANAGGAAFRQCLGDTGTKRVTRGDQAEELEVLLVGGAVGAERR